MKRKFNVELIHSKLKKFCADNGFLLWKSLEKCGFVVSTWHKGIRTWEINEEKLRMVLDFMGDTNKIDDYLIKE